MLLILRVVCIYKKKMSVHESVKKLECRKRRKKERLEKRKERQREDKKGVEDKL